MKLCLKFCVNYWFFTSEMQVWILPIVQRKKLSLKKNTRHFDQGNNNYAILFIKLDLWMGYVHL